MDPFWRLFREADDDRGIVGQGFLWFRLSFHSTSIPIPGQCDDSLRRRFPFSRVLAGSFQRWSIVWRD